MCNIARGLSLIALNLCLVGCSVAIVSKSVEPEHACSGDDLSVHVELDHKVDHVRVFRKNGSRVAEGLGPSKVFDLTIPSVTPDVPGGAIATYRVRGRKIVENWFDEVGEFEQSIALYDSPHISQPFTPSQLISTSQFSNESITGTENVCHDVCDPNDTRKACEQECTVQPACYEKVKETTTVTGAKWSFSAGAISDRIRTVRVINENSFPVDLLIDDVSVGQITANSEVIVLSQVHPSRVTVRGDILAPITRVCQDFQRRVCCANESGASYTDGKVTVSYCNDGGPTTPSDPLSCFRDIRDAIKLELLCDQP